MIREFKADTLEDGERNGKNYKETESQKEHEI
jgi:hypothetical protein